MFSHGTAGPQVSRNHKLQLACFIQCRFENKINVLPKTNWAQVKNTSRPFSLLKFQVCAGWICQDWEIPLEEILRKGTNSLNLFSYAYRPDQSIRQAWWRCSRNNTIVQALFAQTTLSSVKCIYSSGLLIKVCTECKKKKCGEKSDS